MGEIILKVPKKKKKLQLIQSEKVLNDMIAERQAQMRHKFEFDNIEGIVEYKKFTESEEFIELISFSEDRDNDEFIKYINNQDRKNIYSKTEEEINKKSTEIINKINYDVISEDLNNDPEIDIGLPSDLITKPEKKIFTEIYSVTASGKPIQIQHNDEKNKISLNLVEKYVQNAYDHGYEDCQEIANLNIQTRVTEAYKYVRRIDKLMVDIRQHYATQINELRKKIIELSCVVAEVIIETEIVKDENIVVKQIEKAINELNDDTVFNIIINPNDMKILGEVKSILSNSSKKIVGAKISTDDKLSQGDCVLSTSAGNIDATIKTQINKIREELINIDNERQAKQPISSNIPDIEIISDDFLQKIDAEIKIDIDNDDSKDDENVENTKENNN